MNTFSAVVVEPQVKGLGALSAAREYLPACPLCLQRAVEALGLTVGPEAARFDEALLRAEERHGILESTGFSVCGAGSTISEGFSWIASRNRMRPAIIPKHTHFRAVSVIG
ncbi:hypothetical protein [Cryobacterium sp. Hz9]|uniref:hypothetical protein n=1 Tax=Cryobacterium sp. Hz9 TaxID=1259167 RepID=UPI00141AFDCC